MESAASKSEPVSFPALFCDQFRARMSRLADDRDATFVNACTSRYSPFRTFLQNAIGAKETPNDSVVSEFAQSADVAAIRKDVATLLQCMADAQLIDLLCTSLPNFRRLWLSADASSDAARQRLLLEIDQFTFEAALAMMADGSRFRLIALDCNARYEKKLELRKNLWESFLQLFKYLLGKHDANAAAAATLQLKIWAAILVGGSAAIGAGVHHHIVVARAHSAAAVHAAIPSPAINTAVPVVTPTGSVPTETVRISPVDAHREAAPAKTAEGQKHHAAASHVPKKDEHVATTDNHVAAADNHVANAKDAHKPADTSKTDSAKKGIFGFLRKSSHDNTTETEKQRTASSKNTNAQTNTSDQANTDKQKKGMFGFLKKNKNKNNQTQNDNASNAQTKQDKTAAK